MPKNIVIIDEEKADLPASEELRVSQTAASYERVLPSPDMLLQTTERPAAKRPNILRGGNRANIAHTPVVSSAVTVGVPRIVTVSAAPDRSRSPQSQAAVMSNSSAPRLESSQADPLASAVAVVSLPFCSILILGPCGWPCRCLLS